MTITHTFGGETKTYDIEFISDTHDGYLFKARDCPISSFESKSVDDGGNEVIITEDRIAIEDGKAMFYFTATLC